MFKVSLNVLHSLICKYNVIATNVAIAFICRFKQLFVNTVVTASRFSNGIRVDDAKSSKKRMKWLSKWFLFGQNYYYAYDLQYIWKNRLTWKAQKYAFVELENL